MRSISARAISGFVRAVRYLTGTPARSNHLRSFVQFSGRKRRNATITGTSPRASVSDTSVWQLAVLPKAEAYCGATPTECWPFFGTAAEPVCLNKQFRLQRRCVPDARRDKMVHLIIIARRKTPRHRLNALAIAGTYQARHIKWTHLPPRFVA